MATASIPGVSVTSTQIDHIIILLSPKDFTNLPTWLTDNFTIIEGGTHSKGTSQNKLIIFKDGSYLELFSWVDPPPENVEPFADFPGWADRPEGCIIDWALTGDDAHGKFNEVTTRLKDLLSQDVSLNVTYDQPVAGGRRRKDGQELRWVTTRPRRLNTAEDGSPPNVPFFCHDISPRLLRVPYKEGAMDGPPHWPAIVEHPCGATGIASIAIEVPEEQIESLAKLYEAVLGTSAVRPNGGSIYFELESPEQGVKRVQEAMKSVKSATDSDPTAREAIERPCLVKLSVATGSNNAARSTGLSRLTLRTSAEARNGQRLNDDGFDTPIELC